MIFTNIKNCDSVLTNHIKEKTVLRKTQKQMIKMIIENHDFIILDVETYALDFSWQDFYDDFIFNKMQDGNKITETTKKSAMNYADSEQKERALDAWRSGIRLVQIATEKHIFIFDSFSEDLQELFTAISGIPVAGQNIKFDLKVIYTNYDYNPGEVYCTMIAHKIIKFAKVVGWFKSDLATIVNYYLDVNLAKGFGGSDWSQTISYDQFKYAVEDISYLRAVIYKQVDMINEKSIEEVAAPYFNELLKDKVTVLEMNFVNTLAKIEIAGMPLNVKGLSDLSKELHEKIDKIQPKFVWPANCEESGYVNTKSPKQLMEFLDLHGVDVISTSKDTLVKYKEVPIVKDLLDLKVMQKQVQMIDDYINEWMYEDGYVFSSFNQIRASSGRMSSKEINAQQIPRAIKKIFYKAKPGRAIIKSDYPSLEARIMAEIADDKTLINIFNSGGDMHLDFGAFSLGKPESEITEEERRIAKSANFGFMFGMGAKTYVTYAFTNYGVDVTLDESFRLRELYLKRYSGIKKFHNMNSYKLKDNYDILIRTILGRRMLCDSFTNANNQPIQGTGAEIIKLAANIFDRRCEEKNLDAQIINIVHDELVVDCDIKQKKRAKEFLKYAMETAINYVLTKIETTVEVEEL